MRDRKSNGRCVVYDLSLYKDAKAGSSKQREELLSICSWDCPHVPGLDHSALRLKALRHFALVSGYGKTVSHVVIGLKTAKGTKQLKLDPSIYESLQKEKVEVGDVIYIEANNGSVKVLAYKYISYIILTFNDIHSVGYI